MSEIALREKAAPLLHYGHSGCKPEGYISFSMEGFRFHVHINLSKAFVGEGEGRAHFIQCQSWTEVQSLISVTGRLIGVMQ